MDVYILPILKTKPTFSTNKAEKGPVKTNFLNPTPLSSYTTPCTSGTI